MRQDWCTGCHVPVRSETFAQLLAADEALRQCQRSYEALASSWTQWGERREHLAAELVAARPRAATTAASPAAPVQTAPPGQAAPQPVEQVEQVGDGASATSGAPESETEASAAVAASLASASPDSPASVSTPAEIPQDQIPESETSMTGAAAEHAFAAPPVVATASPASVSSAPRGEDPSTPSADRTARPRTEPEPYREPRPHREPQPRTEPQPRRASAVLTAPALLGVAGASLMIAAAVVFVAIAWTTFTPLMRGLAVLAVAGAVGALSIRLRNMHLPITSGAVGVVAMGFAGAGVMAFLREAGAVGALDLPIALLAAAGAGVLLSRRRIPWVGPASALTTVGAAVGLTAAAVSNAQSAGASGVISPMWAWALTGAVTSYGLAATHARWPWTFARTIVWWSALVWAGVVSVVVPAWSAAAGASVLDSVSGVVPLIALAAMARWAPQVAVAATVGIATLLAPAVGSAAGATGWQLVIVLAALIVAGIVVGLRLASTPGRALAFGLLPAVAVVAIATIGYALLTALSRVIAGEEIQPVEWGAGAAALVLGLGFALLRGWPRETARALPQLFEGAEVVGSLLVASGVGVLALGVAELAPAAAIHAALAAAMTVAGGLLLVASRLWAATMASAISEWVGIALLAVAGGHGAWGLHIPELGLALSLGAALVPLATLAVVARRHPWPSTVVVSVLATAIVASAAMAVGAGVVPALTIAVGFAALVAWLVPSLPSAQRRPIVAGLLPVLVWGFCCALWTGATTLGWIFASAAAPDGWGAAAALATALALASARRLPFPGVARWSEPVGAAIALVAVPGVLAVLAHQTDLARSWTTAGVGIASGIVLAGLLPLWREFLARHITRVGAVVLVTLGGVGALIRLAADHQALAPALTLTLTATALLVLASRWWPGTAAGPAALLTTLIAPACASRGGLDLTAGAALTALAAVVVLTVLARTPRRWQVPGTAGAALAILVAGAGSLVVAGFAFGVSLVGWYPDPGTASPWWALALSAAGGLILDRLRRLDVGAGLARGLTRAGAVSVVLTVIVATPTLVALVNSAEDVRHLFSPLIAVALTVGVVAWAGRWSDSRAAAIVRRGTIGWTVLLAFALQVQIAMASVPWTWGLLVVLGVAVALICGARWWPAEVVAPAVALVTLAPLAVTFAIAASVEPAVCFMGLLLVACAWIARRFASAPRLSLLVGAAPAGVVFVFGVMTAFYLAVWALFSHLGGTMVEESVISGVSRTGPSWWDIGVVVVACALALTWRSITWFRGWMPLAVVAVVATMLPPVGAAATLSVVALAVLIWARLLGAGAGVPAAASALAVLWAVGSDLALAGTFMTVTVVTLAVARGWRTASFAWGAIATPFAAAAAGTFVARAADASELAAPAAMGLGLLTVLVLIGSGPGRLRESLAATAIVITLVVPLLAESIEMAGVTLLLAAVAWWRLRSADLDWAMWVSAGTAWAGTVLILVGAEVQVIEAYTAVPALFALLIGLQRMRERPQLRSITALWPGLALALVPSYLAVILEPDSLLRTILLVVATVVLALVGVRLRWFAPILATAVTAVVLSILQIVVGANLVVRLVAFAVVGSLLLVISSWFEKLKELR